MAAILVSGRPGCGKTTLVRSVVEALRVPAGGFYTRETRGADGRRTGFELVTLDGQAATLADVRIAGRQRVGRYGVDVSALERLGVPAIEAAVESGRLVVIDEIGKMELLSAAFQRVVVEAVRRHRAVFGTIMRARHPFADELKAQPDIAALGLTKANRDEVRATREDGPPTPHQPRSPHSLNMNVPSKVIALLRDEHDIPGHDDVPILHHAQ